MRRYRWIEIAGLVAWLAVMVGLVKFRVQAPANVHAPSWSCVQRGDTLHCREDLR